MEVAGLRKTSDARGAATFELEAGRYRIGVPDPAWWGGSDPFTAPTEETVRVHVSRGWRLRVVARNEGGGPVAAARVEVRIPGVGLKKTATTDERGEARIAPCGWCKELMVRVASEMHLESVLFVEPPEDPDGEVLRRVVLRGGDPLDILVLEEDRTPVPFAHLYIVHRTSQQVHTSTDERGAAVVPGVVTPPSVSVRATARDGRNVERIIPVPPDSRGRSVELTMPPGRTFAGIVVRANDGAPVENAKLLFGDSWGRWTVAATTGSNGRFCIARGPDEGDRCRLWVTAPGLAATEVRVGPGNADDLRIELREAGRLRGRITDTDGKPVAGVRVSTVENTGHPARTRGRTDADGRFELAGVLPGADWLKLRRDGYPEDAAQFEGLEPGETLDLGEIRLTRVFEFSATVVDEQGKPVARGWVEGPGVIRAVRNGKFAPITLSPYSAEVRFGGPGFLSSGGHGVTPETKELVLHRACSLRGRLIRKETGQPVTDAEIVLRAMRKGHAEKSGWIATLRTDDRGYFEVSGLPRGLVEIRVPKLALRAEIEITGVNQNAGSIPLEVSPGAAK
jgi:hypothetical protein